MTNKYRHKQIPRAQKKYRKLAAAFAGAAILSAAMLPGISSATVHAAANPEANKAPVTSHQKAQQKSTTKTKTNKKAKSQKPADYEKVLDITATAYAPGAHDNDQWGSKTFIGSEIRPGVIAVDPSVIPLGSRVYIEYPDGHGEHAIAEDTGGAIKGNRIDVAKWTVNEAKDFGMKDVKVYVISSPDKA